MAKRAAGGEGNSGALVFGSKATFFWGVVAGVVLSLAVCSLWCGKRCCGKGGMTCSVHGEKAPAEGKTNSK